MQNDNGIGLNKDYIAIFIIPMIFTLFVEVAKISNLITDTICLVLYFLILVYLYRKKTYLLIEYGTFLIGSTWAIIAVFLLENLTVVVANDSSYRYGSFAIYVFCWILYYFVIMICEDKYKKKIILQVSESVREKRNNTICWILLLATMVELFAFLSIINKPYFLFSTDRASYARDVMPSWLNGHVGFFSLFLPCAVMVLKQRKGISILYIGLYFLLNIWVGEKFTGLFLGIYFVGMSFIMLYKNSISRFLTKKVMRILCIIILLCIALVYVQMTVIGGRSFVFYFVERISAQGYLWWLTYAKDSMHGIHLNEIGDELVPFYTSLSGNMNEYNFGIYKLMHLFQDPERVQRMLTEGYRATESTRATFYYYLKIPGLVLGQILLAIVTYRIIKNISKQICSYNFIKVFFLCYILRNFIAIQSMSDFYLLVKPEMCLSYFMLLIGNSFSLNLRTKFPKLRFRVKYKLFLTKTIPFKNVL